MIIPIQKLLEPDTNSRESELHATSLIPSLCPAIVFSNLPSATLHILINLSAEQLANQSPLGENLTDDTAFV
ncbi:hypothetical protein BLOT_008049 [Blomia tropicalis]|nr:hypothetical protein BLOT_008049 [Blomia tropicalis]